MHSQSKPASAITSAMDGLSVDWHKYNVCWMNPPYGEPEHICKDDCIKKICVERGRHNNTYVPGVIDWISRAYAESLKGAIVVCLLPVRTDTLWWHDYVMKSDAIYFVKGRLKFGNGENSAPFPSAVVIFRQSLHPFPDLGVINIK